MEIHPETRDVKGQGQWDANTLRYVPMFGGSRSRLPIGTGDNIPRYHGFVGIDESLTPTIYTMAALYQRLGGGVYIPEGQPGVFISLLLEQATKWMRPAPAEG